MVISEKFVLRWNLLQGSNK